MTDVDIIAQGYANALGTIFNAFFNRLIEAEGGPGSDGAVALAEQAFQNGLKAAREARDRALKLL
jgi:hypothetical protein